MTDFSLSSEICPQCELGILVKGNASHALVVDAVTIRVPNVKVEECRHCGFRSFSGSSKDDMLEVLLAQEYERVSDLVDALKAAGYHGMFLKEVESESYLSFGSREYVSSLPEDVRRLYLDNESYHVISGLRKAQSATALIEIDGRRCRLKLPRLGEGENAVVYEYEEDPRCVLKIAKPRAYSREHLRLEYEVAGILEHNGIPVSRILQNDAYGSFMIKEKLCGESLAKIYPSLGDADAPGHRRVRFAVEAFVGRLVALFDQYPDAKTSINPDNIFVLLTEDSCRCMLADAGPAPFHDYSNFVFSRYWDTVIPQKIEQYKRVGYL